jgi:hypothetical protein
MMRPRSVFLALWIAWLALLMTTTALAAAPDRAGQGELEDQLQEGEIDPEDFLALHWSRTAFGPARGAAYLGIEAFRADKTSGAAEIGAMLVVELPLERFAHPRAMSVALPVESRESSPVLGPSSFDAAEQLSLDAAPVRWPLADAVPLGPAPRALGQTAPPKAERPPPTPALAVTTEVARSCVRAALRTAGLGDDTRLESVAARARSSASLPELRLRAVRTLGESGRISLSEDDPSRYVASGAATNVLEARVTFRLDRLLFADEEIVVERARLDRAEQRLRVTAKVLQTLFEWQKAYVLLQDPTLPAEDRLSAVLREAESSAVLDMMTGGWFGAYRAALAARVP